MATMNRRDLLTGAATALAASAALGAPRVARAFTVEEMPQGSALGLAFANRCGGSAEHAGLLTKLQDELARRVGAPGTLLTATERCPICGCPVTATRYVR
jgi:hypothetical protein